MTMGYQELFDRDRAQGTLSEETKLAIGEYIHRNRPSRQLVAKMAQRLGKPMVELFAYREVYKATPGANGSTPLTSVPVGERPAKMFSWNGRAQTAAAWAQELGVTNFVIYDRAKRGKALDGSDSLPSTRGTKPAKAKWQPKKVSWNGRTMTIKEWSQKLGVPEGTIFSRNSRGLALDGSDAKTKSDKRKHGPAPRLLSWKGQSLSAADWGRKLGVNASTITSRDRVGRALDGSDAATVVQPKKVAAMAKARAVLATQRKQKDKTTMRTNKTKTNGRTTTAFEDAQTELSMVGAVLNILTEVPVDRARRVLEIANDYVTKAQKADVSVPVPAVRGTGGGDPLPPSVGP